MPHINQVKDSKFLTKEDCGQGILVTIKDCKQENTAMQGQPPELKWCLYFHEMDGQGQPLKPMVLNTTNATLIAAFLRSEFTEHWVGHKIVLYNDPAISFGGKLTGGIRARAPRGQAAAPAQPHYPAQPGYAPPAPAPNYPAPPQAAPVPVHAQPQFRPPPPPPQEYAPPPPPPDQNPPPQEDDVPFRVMPQERINRALFGTFHKLA